MGGSSSSFLNEAAADRKISKEIRDKKHTDEETIRLLLLGTGESGKTTLGRQFKILYGVPWTDAELMDLRPTVYTNIISNVVLVLKHLEQNNIPLPTAELQAQAKRFLDETISDDADVTLEIGQAVKRLWNTPEFQATWKSRNSFQVSDCLEYYVGEIDRISQQPYTPNQQDILHARVRTSGIIEERYLVDGVPFVLLDVGGQRNERKKWEHAFEGRVTCLIWVCAINEYDQVLFEDKKTNRLQESLRVFQEITSSQWFARTSVIVFLNKNDLFVAKLQKSPLRLQFPDFTGPFAEDANADLSMCVKAAHAYISNLFVQRKPEAQKYMYIHVTEATDTKQTHNVLGSCKDIIMRGNLKQNGFME